MSLSKAGCSLRLPFAVSLCLFALLPRCGDAQTSPVHSQATPESVLEELSSVTSNTNANDMGPAGIIPVMKGFNASLGTSWQHDSSNGWSTLLSPNVAYRFNQYVSMDVGVPLYFYINIYANVGTKAKPEYAYAGRNGVFGDTSLSLRGDAPLPLGIGHTARRSRWGCLRAIPVSAWAQGRSRTTSTTTSSRTSGCSRRTSSLARATAAPWWTRACGRTTSRWGRSRTFRRGRRSICR